MAEIQLLGTSAFLHLPSRVLYTCDKEGFWYYHMPVRVERDKSDPATVREKKGIKARVRWWQFTHKLRIQEYEHVLWESKGLPFRG